MKSNNISIAAALLGFGLTIAACNETSNDFTQPTTPYRPIADSLIAFPGAEGFGRFATGGRGGEVYHVTSLSDSETPAVGTLRYAVTQTAARTIVFDIAGTINLVAPLEIAYGDLTIAGQSAPGDGICVAGAEVRINASNVIIRYLRFRPGNDLKYLDPTTGDPVAFDGLNVTGQRNIIIDHCSFSWAAGKCLSLYNNENTTVQWCIMSESLNQDDSIGSGSNWGGVNASFHHNLIAHCMDGTPRLTPGETTQRYEYTDIRNNVIYNWSKNGSCGGEGMYANIVNNYYKPGPATLISSDTIQSRIFAVNVRTIKDCYKTDEEADTIMWYSPTKWAPMEHIWGKFFIEGNVMAGNDDVSMDNWTKGVLYQRTNGPEVDNLYTQETQDSIRLNKQIELSDLKKQLRYRKQGTNGLIVENVANGITTHSAEQAYQLVVTYAGCTKKRDVVDERILQETKDGLATYGTYTGFTGKGFIKSPKDVGGYPSLTATTEELAAIKDSDGDGLPDEWEKTHGLNPRADGDGRTVKLSSEGYTNLEVYLNSLIE